MLTAVEQLALKLEFASTVIPLNGLRNIAEALKAGHSYQTYRINNPPSFKSYWMTQHQHLLHEIFILGASKTVTTADINVILKKNFDAQLQQAQANQVSMYDEVFASTLRPAHSSRWLQFETENFIVNSPLGGTRLNNIDTYRRRQLAELKSERWFLGMVYADKRCLSPIQKKAFRNEFNLMTLWFSFQETVLTDVQKELAEEYAMQFKEMDDANNALFFREIYDLLTDDQKKHLTKIQKEKLFSQLTDEPTQQTISTLAEGKRMRKRVERMERVEYAAFDDEAEQRVSARSAPVKRAKVAVSAKHSNSQRDFFSLDNHIFTHISNQSVSQPTSNTGFFQKRTNDYLDRFIAIPPLPPISADELMDRLVTLFGISRDKTKYQPSEDLRDADWGRANVYFNTLGKRIAKVIRDDVPTGTVVIFGAAIATVSRKVREMSPRSTSPVDNDSDTESSTSRMLSRLGTTIFRPAAVTYAAQANAEISRVQTLMRSVSEIELELLRRRAVRDAQIKLPNISTNEDNSPSTADDAKWSSTSRRSGM